MLSNRTMLVTIYHCFALAAVLDLNTVLAQPQCMDLLPPYQKNRAAASYCAEYSGFGCCGVKEDRYASKRARFALEKHVDSEERVLCADFARNVSCLSCSPYAGHIFDSASGSAKFPFLCRGYCIEAYRNCRVSLLRMFKLRPWREALVSLYPKNEQELVRDARAFCEHYTPAEDSPFCYPRVLEQPKAEQNLQCLCAMPVANKLRMPTAAVHAGDGSGRLFITEELGVIRILQQSGKLLEEPFVNISSQLNATLERGLFNLAFHPCFKENGLLYVFHNSIANFNSSGNVIASNNITEFRVRDDNPNQVNYSTQRLVFSHSYTDLSPIVPDLHGGALFFKDGFLFLGIGDTEEVEDYVSRAQDLTSYHSKILRFDVDNRDPGKEYAVPPDNPFIGDPNALPEIYSYGWRMPWKCAVDRGDPKTREGAGRVFCTDVGTNVTEEVNLLVKGGNYGRPIFEGDVCLVDKQTCDASKQDAVFPIGSYVYGTNGTAIIDVRTYRGCLFPNLKGKHILGDFTKGLQSLTEDPNTGTWKHHHFCLGDDKMCPGAIAGQDILPFLISFGEDEGGELYAAATSAFDINGRDGVVYQLVDPAKRADPRTCKRSGKFSV